MALTAVLTTFDRSAMPSNLLTPADWQRFARAWLGSGAAWRKAVRLYAEQKGGALVWRVDDSLETYTKLSSGKISRRTYKPGKWAWAAA